LSPAPGRLLASAQAGLTLGHRNDLSAVGKEQAMSFVDTNQPNGTPTRIDLGIPDLERAMAFYGAVFGWEFEVGSPETMRYTQCLLDGRRAAALAENPDPQATAFWWNVYLAADDCDTTARRISAAGGTLVQPPMDVMDQGRMAIAKDPVGAQFGLWQGRAHVGCQVVNQPGALLRNDLVTPDPEPARAFYAAVFDFTLDANPDLPDVDFTFLRRPDGYEIGGIMGVAGVPSSAWNTLFEVADTDAAVARTTAAGGTVTSPPEDFVYGRVATLNDPFGAEFSVGARPKQRG
jgi:predicted enzyme related to lactoylglutathione lyase